MITRIWHGATPTTKRDEYLYSMCCCFRSSNNSALVVTQILMAILFSHRLAVRWKPALGRLWNVRINLGVCLTRLENSVGRIRISRWMRLRFTPSVAAMRRLPSEWVSFPLQMRCLPTCQSSGTDSC
jgi:hypothetical protein